MEQVRTPELMAYAIRAMKRHNFDDRTVGGGAERDRRYVINGYLWSIDGEYLTNVPARHIGVTIGQQYAIYSCKEVKAAADTGIVQPTLFGGAA